MKNLHDYIIEADDANMVYVVSDQDGGIVGIYDTEDAANDAKKEFEFTPDMKATIKKEKRSDYEGKKED